MQRGRPRKLTPEQIQHAALDRQNGMSWRDLSKKYKCAINTIRTALLKYSDEFTPIPIIERPSLENQLKAVQARLDKIQQALIKRHNDCNRYRLNENPCQIKHQTLQINVF